MTAAKHTPGPWSVRDIASREFYIGPADDGDAPSIAIVLARVGRSVPEQRANAQLIARAPAMADALDLIVRRLQADIDDGSRPDQWSMEDLIEKVRRALPNGWEPQ